MLAVQWADRYDMRLDRPCGLLIALALLAGCSSDDSGSVPQIGEPERTLAVAEPHFTMSAEGCSGWFSAVNYPGHSGPAEPFPGWDPEPWVISRVFTYGFDCERISWGPFERPLRVVYDYHDFMEVPEACFGDYSLWAFNVILVNDPEIADYLVETYGMPAQFATIEWALSADPARTLDWTWTVAGDQSMISILEDDHDEADFISPESVFWMNDRGGVSRIDLSYDLMGQVADRVAIAEYASPMLNAGQANAELALGTAYVPPSQISGEIQEWNDMDCTAPA